MLVFSSTTSLFLNNPNRFSYLEDDAEQAEYKVIEKDYKQTSYLFTFID